MDTLTSLMYSFLSWRVALMALLGINVKSLPLFWHLKLFYLIFRHYSPHRRPVTGVTTEDSVPVLFAPVSIFTRAPLLELDWNLHKSNATYFSDLDHSRMALLASLLSPGFARLNAELATEGHTGSLGIILGSVHASFYKEVKPYEQYEVRSRLLCWDEKWLSVVTWFVRPAKRNGREETILASALSKCVVKKGRFTVTPERCLSCAGLLLLLSSSETEAREDQKESVKLGDNVSGAVGLTSAAKPETLERAACADDPKLLLDESEETGNLVQGRVGTTRLRDTVLQMKNEQGRKIAEAWLALDKSLLEEGRGR